MARTRRTGKRGQAALEYMVTYGWSFLAILATIGALTYFGVINPSNWLPDECQLGEQLQCVDFEADSAGIGTINLYVRNDFGRDIEITDARLVINGSTEVGGVSGVVRINASDIDTISITGITSYMYPDEKQQFVVRVYFNRVGGAETHALTGFLHTRTK